MPSPVAKELYETLRSRGREAAMQVLYQDDLNPQVGTMVGESLLSERFPMSELLEFDHTELLSFAQRAFAGRSAAALASVPHEELAQQIRAEALEFARHLVDGVRRNREALDQRLAGTAENWSVDRMAVTDRNVLRIGAFELLYTNRPPRAVIDQAVELAKRYGTAQSGPFVNGILDKLMHAKGKSPLPE